MLLPNRYLVDKDRVEIPDYITFEGMEVVTDFLYQHHIDIHGLIPLGYALQAPEGMYKNNKKKD